MVNPMMLGFYKSYSEKSINRTVFINIHMTFIKETNPKAWNDRTWSVEPRRLGAEQGKSRKCGRSPMYMTCGTYSTSYLMDMNP